MRTVEIFQLKEYPSKDVGEMLDGVKVFEPGRFSLLATVEVAAGEDEMAALGKAFALTNNVDAPWWERPGVRLVGPPRPLRSSSIGDVFRLDGIAYSVVPLGFDRVPAAEE